MAISLDLDKADEVLRQEWKRVLKEENPEYNESPDIRDRVHRLIHDHRYGVMTFKYMFLSNVLAKAIHPEVHYRAIQTESDLTESFSSRTIAEQVIVDWEQENGQKLGGSNEPGTSKPFRWPEVSLSIQVMREDVLEHLYNLLEDLETQTTRGVIDPVDVLRQTLYEISKLDSQTVDYESPTAVPHRELERYLPEYLAISGGGERLAAVAAAIVKAYYFHADDDGWEVAAEHVNIPDQQSKAAGDIEVRKDSELVHAWEVKDKPVAKNDITHAIEKAQKHELGEYLYLIGSGFKSGEKRAALAEAENAPIEMVFVFKNDMIGQLKFVGKDGRKKFIDYVGEFLNDMRATDNNKKDWKEIAEKFSN